MNAAPVSKTIKCVVWDLDNTLWPGVAAEGPEDTAPEPDAGLLDIIMELEKRGILSSVASRNDPALGEPLAGLTPEQRVQFEEGKKVFQRVFEPKDGLGPLFNGNSCAECHEKPVLGGVGDEVEVHAHGSSHHTFVIRCFSRADR